MRVELFGEVDECVGGGGAVSDQKVERCAAGLVGFARLR